MRRISVCVQQCACVRDGYAGYGNQIEKRLSFYELQFLGAVKRISIRRLNRVYPSPLLAQGP